ncbi:discoidin domain-containing protein [Flavicella marina]|uniref:discoidin domain-containing protein n=1 Tax=Flavicella marina TaxID=1475951 RepID=UPI001264CE65|nr:discoidin domain-containing protein [Flavicella marina]
MALLKRIEQYIMKLSNQGWNISTLNENNVAIFRVKLKLMKIFKLRLINAITFSILTSLCSIASGQKSKINTDDILVKANIWETKEHGAGDFFPKLTIDNDISGKSSWRGERIDGIKPWIQYDLKSPIEISQICIAFYNGDQRNYYFDISISDDEKNWNSIFNGKSKGVSLDYENFDINKKARYIRVTGNGNTHEIYFNWTNITEVLLYKIGGSK